MGRAWESDPKVKEVQGKRSATILLNGKVQGGEWTTPAAVAYFPMYSPHLQQSLC